MTVTTCRNGDIELAYETFGDGRPLLLVAPMGQASRLMYHDDFCAALVRAGFHVARFDNRDGGRSTHLAAGASYSLADMATDAVAVLDTLGWPSANVVGASLGGMIGQVMAVHHADRVRTLTSMSAAPCVSLRVSRPKIRTALKLIGLSRKGSPADHLVALCRITGSPAHPVDEQWIRHIADQAPPDQAADRRHIKAMQRSGDRRRELAGITAPTLVIHGAADPLQSLRAARETVQAIPGARLVTYPDMGHDLPRPLWPSVVGEISALAGATVR